MTQLVSTQHQSFMPSHSSRVLSLQLIEEGPRTCCMAHREQSKAYHDAGKLCTWQVQVMTKQPSGRPAGIYPMWYNRPSCVEVTAELQSDVQVYRHYVTSGQWCQVSMHATLHWNCNCSKKINTSTHYPPAKLQRWVSSCLRCTTSLRPLPQKNIDMQGG